MVFVPVVYLENIIEVVLTNVPLGMPRFPWSLCTSAINAIGVCENDWQRVWALVVCALCGFGIGVSCGLCVVGEGMRPPLIYR